MATAEAAEGEPEAATDGQEGRPGIVSECCHAPVERVRIVGVSWRECEECGEVLDP